MAEQRSRYRTAWEVGVISILIYVILGTPGLRSFGKDHDSRDIPKAKARVENIVHPRRDLQCPKHRYDVHLFSASPLVLYVDGFLTDSEVDHLVALSDDKWKISTVSNNGVEAIDDSVRKSERAAIERDDSVQCIEQRALDFQGWPQETFIEKLWTQRYNESGHYSLHYDWAVATKQSRRVSTFMVYLKADCVGGGTNFPRMPMPKEPKWCEFIECGSAEAVQGVTFKPRAGSAVFWMNFDADGRGYKETIHSGMPVISGQKIGLNIWSWYQAGHTAVED